VTGANRKARGASNSAAAGDEDLLQAQIEEERKVLQGAARVGYGSMAGYATALAYAGS